MLRVLFEDDDYDERNVHQREKSALLHYDTVITRSDMS